MNQLERTDMGVDEEYGECCAIKGVLVAIAFSLPIWALIIGVAVYFLKK